MNITKSSVLLGAHMSIAGGFDKALERGHSIGCTTIQIFTKSNRQWQAKPITQAEVDAYNNAQKHCNISPVIAHASYLINLASPKKEVIKKSTEALIIELERCQALGIKTLVLHPGSRLEMPLSEALEQVSFNMDTALTKAQSTCRIALETMAGQGSSVCSRLESIGHIIAHSKNKNRLQTCVDTCHVFAAGYLFNTPEHYNQFWHDFDTCIGRKYLAVIHMNDSKKTRGSHVDRHEDIGKGKIGLQAFTLIMNDQKLAKIPKILETPKTSLNEDRKNMETLISLIK